MAKLDRRPTIQDVARAAGVSPTTVSHLISGSRNVSETSRRKITRAIEELEYTPSETARALRTQKTRTIALVIRNIVHDWSAHLASGAGRVLRANGYSLAIYETDDDPKVIEGIARILRERRADGAIVGHHNCLAEGLVNLPDSVPLILMGSPNQPLMKADHVSVDEADGIAQVTRHVCALTERPIVFIGGPDGDPASIHRKRAFAAELELLKPGTDMTILSADYSVEGGAEAMRSVLTSQGRGIGGVVCANDLIAIGAIAEARNWGLNPPGDFVITGYDNIEAAALVTPSLTTVETFEEEAGARSAEILLERLAGKGPEEHVSLVMPTRLVIRGSAPPL